VRNILIIRNNLLKTDRKIKDGLMYLIIYILLLTSKIYQHCYIILDSMYVDCFYVHKIVSYTEFMECK
jgi:hypothetical protein